MSAWQTHNEQMVGPRGPPGQLQRPQGGPCWSSKVTSVVTERQNFPNGTNLKQQQLQSAPGQFGVPPLGFLEHTPNSLDTRLNSILGEGDDAAPVGVENLPQQCDPDLDLDLCKLALFQPQTVWVLNSSSVRLM